MQFNVLGATFIAFAMLATAAGIVATDALTPALLRLTDETGRTGKAIAAATNADSPAHHQSRALRSHD